MVWVGVTASVFVVILAMMAFSPRLRTPIAFDVGAILMAIGMLSVAESIFTGQPCSGKAITMRWWFNSSGLLLILVAYLQSIRR